METEEIQKALNDGNLFIGTDTVIKKLKAGSIKKVFVSSNAPEVVKEDVSHYAKLSDSEVVFLDSTSEDLKEVCKKGFNISLVAI